VGTIFFRFDTIHAFDRQTDGQKDLGHTVRCITDSRMVKMVPVDRAVTYHPIRKPYTLVPRPR